MTMSAFLLAYLALAGVSGQTESSRSFSEHFVEANGIRLHYLDWGGQGRSCFCLASTHPRLLSTSWLLAFATASMCTRSHAVVSHRRTPASGYELATLVADIMAFLDAKELLRVHLVGHSLAGLELTQIASRWPRRVRSLVYLDAIADPATAYAVLQRDPLSSVPATGAVWTQISRWWNGYSVDFSGVEARPARSHRARPWRGRLTGDHAGWMRVRARTSGTNS